MSVESLLSKLDGVQGHGPRWRAICPAHESRHGTRSLSIYEPEPGRILLRCHAGCDVASIVGAVRLDLADLFPPRVDDDKRAPHIRKPWRARDVVAALKHELGVAWIVLADVASGRELGEADRERAGVARERIAALMLELEHAA